MVGAVSQTRGSMTTAHHTSSSRPKTGARATRLYLPTADTPAWCRRCWGLSYDSRKGNYRTGGFSAHCLVRGRRQKLFSPASVADWLRRLGMPNGKNSGGRAKTAALLTEELPTQWIAGVMPTYWPMRAVWAAAAGDSWLGVLGIGFVVNVAALVVSAALFERRLMNVVESRQCMTQGVTRQRITPRRTAKSTSSAVL